MKQTDTANDPNDQSGMKDYTTDYEWFFSCAPKAQPDGRLTWTYQVTLTVSHLAEEEREQVTDRFHRRLDWLSKTLDELEEIKITDQLVWRCQALIFVQIQKAFFDLENVGFLLMVNGVALGRDMLRLHELLQKFQAMPTLPDMEAYYQLPTQYEQSDGCLH
jgi:hypothetical protein